MYYIEGAHIPRTAHAGFFTALVVLGFGVNVEAAEGDDKAGDRNIVMMVAQAGEEEAYSPLMSAVRAQLIDFPVAFEVKWVDDFPVELPAQEEFSVAVSNESGASMVFWCDFSRGDRMYLYFAIPALGRVVVRRLDGSGVGFTAETLGIILRNLVDAVLKGAVDSIQPFLPEEEPEEEPQTDSGNGSALEQTSSGSTVEPSTVEATGDPTEGGPSAGDVNAAGAQDAGDDAGSHPGQNRLYVQVGYALDVLSTSHPTTHGVSFVLDVFLKRGWHLFAGYTAAVPIQAKQEGIELELARHPVLFGTRYGRTFGRLELGAGLSCSLDYVGESVKAVRGPVVDRASGGELVFSLVPFYQMNVRVFSIFYLYFDIGIDIPLKRPNYIIRYPSEDTSVRLMGTWAVRPVGRLGLMVGFL